MPDAAEMYYCKFLQGDAEALEELVRAYSDALLRFVYLFVNDSAAAEDIMEDAFAALIAKRKRFNGDGALKAYLYKIARNKSIDCLRSRRRKEVPLADVENVLAAADAERQVIDGVRNERLYACIAALPAGYRDVLSLTYFDGFSAEEAGRVMGKTRKQVYNLLARAKRALKESMIKEGYGYEDI